MSKQGTWTRAALAVLLSGALLAGCSGGGGGSDEASDTTVAGSKTKGAPGDAGAGNEANYEPTGPLVADNGFRPETDGFSFENYGKAPAGSDQPATNLGPDEVRRLYGDAVCEDAASGTCELIPAAQRWMEQANAGTEGGHCQGFSVLAGLMYKKQQDVKAFGGDAVPALEIAANEPLQRNLAYAFTYQTLDAYNAAIFKGTPNEVIDKLIESLKPDGDSYTLGIYRRGFVGGHAVTPYAVEDAGGGVFKALIYDNNYPKITRVITFDKNKNTWAYDTSTNPSEPAVEYEGDATTGTIDVEPTTPGTGVHPCPFCDKASQPPAGGAALGTGGHGATLAQASPPDMDLIYMDGSEVDHGQLLITDEAGHKTGHIGDTFVNEIPGAQIQHSKASKNWLEQIEPDYLVPDGHKYTVTLDGTGMEEMDPSAIGVIGPGSDLWFDNIELQVGGKASITFAPDAEVVSFSSSSPQEPEMEMAVNDDAADFTFLLSGVKLGADQTVTMDMPVNGTEFTVHSPADLSYDLGIDRQDGNNDFSFRHADVPIPAGGTGKLLYSKWDANGSPLDFVSSKDGATQSLDDES